MVVCGHDHGTSIRNGLWQEQIGRTTVVNVGQHMDGPLHATLVVEADGQMNAERRVRL